MDKLKLAALLVLLPLGVLAQGFDYSSIYTVTPEEFPAQQRMAAIIGQSAVSIDDETVGDVRDVITDETGTVVGYLVDSGGFLGLWRNACLRPKGSGRCPGRRHLGRTGHSARGRRFPNRRAPRLTHRWQKNFEADEFGNATSTQDCGQLTRIMRWHNEIFVTLS